jgi:hypothetical protein
MNLSSLHLLTGRTPAIEARVMGNVMGMGDGARDCAVKSGQGGG